MVQFRTFNFSSKYKQFGSDILNLANSSVQFNSVILNLTNNYVRFSSIILNLANNSVQSVLVFILNRTISTLIFIALKIETFNFLKNNFFMGNANQFIRRGVNMGIGKPMNSVTQTKPTRNLHEPKKLRV